MALGVAMAIGAGLGILSSYANIVSQKAQLRYQKKLKALQDRQAIEDLQQGGHDALIANELLRQDTIEGSADIEKQVADAVSKTVVKQAAIGVTGNTVDRITNAIYGAGGDAETDLDLEARAEKDNINAQLRALTVQTERQLIGGQVEDFSTNLGTTLQVLSGAAQGAQSGVSIYNSYKRI